MKKIVFSAVSAIALAVGAYHIAFLAGMDASDVVAVVAAAAAAVVAEQARMRYRWVLAAYCIEAVAVWGALSVGSVGWSIAIAIGGIALLISL